MTADISRHSLRPAQRFTGLVRQQGRVPLDADETEADQLADITLRKLVTETICGRGSPDDGFAVGTPAWDGTSLDFPIAAGSFYLGGTRVRSDGHSYRLQPDWLSFALDSPGPAAPQGARTDLVWLEAAEQVVTATEDSELFERALGGPDSAARRRTMWRTRVQADVEEDCADAFDRLVADVYPGAALADDGAELLSGARLTIGFTRLEPLEDLCRPAARQGFLGARNETFRVQVTQPGRFVWGRDNAAPLYRVQVETAPDGTRRRIIFLTPPRDEFGWPLAGMTVEVLRWGALLDNREKAAEPQGLLLRVATGFDPADRSVQLSDDVPLEFETWFTDPAGPGPEALNPRDETERRAYFFLRVWTGGGAGNAADHPMDVGNEVELGETGLTANFSGPGLAGDYWVVSARPNTPTEVTPWALLDGAPPAGPRRLIAPLAQLRWSSANAAPVVADCRHHFRPLCEVGGCCRVTVGDGRHSFGDVTSIQAAVDRLPPEGGEICIHPGVYAEHVVIERRRDITLTGCGARTLWRALPERPEPLLSIRGSRGIAVRRLAMESRLSECIDAEEIEFGELRATLRRVTLEELVLVCADTAAVRVAGGDGHVVRRCQIELAPTSLSIAEDPDLGRAAALWIGGDDLLVEHCRIGLDRLRRKESPARLDNRGLAPAAAAGARLAMGGIQVGGGSRGVVIRGNRIQGGNGHGITLGSVRFVPDEGSGPIFEAVIAAGRTRFLDRKYRFTAGYGRGALELVGLAVFVDARGCIRVRPTPTAPPLPPDAPDGTRLVAESAGLLRDVRIHGNEIADMGFSGISACAFSGLGSNGFSDAVTVELLDVAENRILRCMRNEIEETTPLQRRLAGWGGIALSVGSGVTIRENVIGPNGARSTEPLCGIFIAVAEQARIERNTIEQNGARPGAEPLRPGLRGGIVIGVAIGGFASLGDSDEDIVETRRPALVVAGNIVDAPSGRALQAQAAGPVMVLGNRLVGSRFSRPEGVRIGVRAATALPAGWLSQRMVASRATADLGDYTALERLEELLGGDAVQLLGMTSAGKLVAATKWRDPRRLRLRGGEMMVNDNQIVLRRHSAEAATSISAVALVSADDLSFSHNQVEVEPDVDFFSVGTFAVAQTLRFTHNKLKERYRRGALSASTRADFNETADNQSTHCLHAVALPQARVFVNNKSEADLRGDHCRTYDVGGVKKSDFVGVTAGLVRR